MSFTFLNQLPSPAEIKRDFPLSEELKQLKKERDAMISDVITGKDDRFLVIIGPCSADREDAVCDYVSRLTKIQEDVADRLIIIPRVRKYLNEHGKKVPEDIKLIQISRVLPARAIRVSPPSRIRKKRLT